MTRSFSTRLRMTPSRRRAFRPRTEGLESRQLLNGGGLDLSFGTNGAVLAGDHAAKAVQIQADGKVVAAGVTVVSGANNDFSLVRLTPSGVLDSTFGSGGKVLTDFVGKADRVEDMALQSDGRIVVAGLVTNTETRPGKGNRATYYDNVDFGVARYLPSGALDTSFGNGGKVTTNISGVTTSDSYNKRDEAYSLAIQTDGKFLVAGKTQTGTDPRARSAAIVRYNANGTLDTSFGQAGKVVTVLSTGEGSVIQDVAVQADGKIVAVGYTQAADASYYWKILVVRYNTDGSLDAGFGTNGIVTTSAGPTDSIYAYGMALLSDGSIVVAGSYEQPISTGGTLKDLALARFTNSGSLDPTFGVGGVVRFDAGSATEFGNALAIQPVDGKLVVVGSYVRSVSENYYVSLAVRFQPNGAVDPGFGTAGVAVNSFTNSENYLFDVAVQSDGKLVGVGTAATRVSSNSLKYDYLITRYLGDTSTPAPTAFRLVSSPGSEVAIPTTWVDPSLALPTTELIRPGTKRSRPSQFVSVK